MKTSEFSHSCMRGLLVGATLLALAIASIVITPFAIAQEVPYTGADIVFIVDQSGSMGGKEYGSNEHPLPNDANKLRFEGPPWAAEWMGRRLLEDDPEHHFTFRMGVVYFGDRAEVANFGQEDTPLWVAAIAPTSEEDWTSSLQNITRSLSSDLWKGRNLGNTNFYGAFAEARELFAQMEQQDSSQRIKAIILITDGWPVVFTADGQQVSVASHMNRVIDYIEEEFPYPDYQVHVLGLNDSDTAYWPITEPYWQQASHGQALKTQGNRKFFADVQAMLNQIIQPLHLGIDDIPIQCGPNFIPPYLDLVRFTFHKVDREDLSEPVHRGERYFIAR